MSLNRLNAYKQTSVKTASQGKLIVMLYDEAIKQMVIAEEELSKKKVKFDAVHNAISKAQDIVTELMASLDFEKGGEISQNLYNLYMFFNRQLVEANINKDTKKLIQVRKFMSDLREAWVSIEGTVVNQNPEASSGVNIAG
ncbi:MAG: flagellar export chaperone FliS [Spirochaetaceae bacterium]|nr:flagellar export chaperone FliS [Spirochaetaceae bacterium]